MVRRALTDGCTTVYTDALQLTLAKNTRLLNMLISGTKPDTIFAKRRDKGTDCYSAAFAIPLELYAKSNGGVILNDQTIAPGSSFAKLLSGKPASGHSLTPTPGLARTFTYQWQICANPATGNWTDIEGATNPEELGEGLLNAAATAGATKLFVRRMATNECGRSSFSDTVTLWAKNQAPAIYLSKDSCNATTVTIKVRSSEPYNLTWLAADQNDRVSELATQDSLLVDRNSPLKPAKYGVVATRKDNGCPSPTTFFNVEALPTLSQEPLWQEDTWKCYGADRELEGTRVYGGSGQISYQWQTSADGKVFTDAATTANLLLSNLTSNIYARRIVRDFCHADTSNIVPTMCQEMC